MWWNPNEQWKSYGLYALLTTTITWSCLHMSTRWLWDTCSIMSHQDDWKRYIWNHPGSICPTFLREPDIYSWVQSLLHSFCHLILILFIMYYDWFLVLSSSMWSILLKKNKKNKTWILFSLWKCRIIWETLFLLKDHCVTTVFISGSWMNCNKAVNVFTHVCKTC